MNLISVSRHRTAIFILADVFDYAAWRTASVISRAVVLGLVFLFGGFSSPDADAGATRAYLMAVYACDDSTAACAGVPSNHTAYILESDTGGGWSRVAGFPSIPAGTSVPDIVRRLNIVYLYTPGEVRRIRVGTGVLVSTDPVSIVDGSGAPVSFVDPSAILDPATGRIVLFYLDSTGVIGDPAGCPDTDGDGIADYPCTKYIRSASETGAEGRTFIQDPGNRLAITIASATDPVGMTASDPDIFSHPGGYVLLLARGQKVQAFTSSGLAGTYAAVAGLPDGVLVDGVGIPSGHYDNSSSNYWILGNDFPTSSSPSVIRRATTSGLSTQLYNSDFTTVSTALDVGLDPRYVMLGSPGFTENRP